MHKKFLGNDFVVGSLAAHVSPSDESNNSGSYDKRGDDDKYNVLRSKSLGDRAVNTLEIDFALATSIVLALAVVINDTSGNASRVPPDTEGNISGVVRVDYGNIPVLLCGNVEADATNNIAKFTVAVRNVGVFHAGWDGSSGGEKVRKVSSLFGGDGDQERIGRDGLNSPVHRGSLEDEGSIVGNIRHVNGATSSSIVRSTHVTREAEFSRSSVGGVNTENPGTRTRSNESEVSVGVESVVGGSGRNSGPASPHFGVLSGEFSVMNAELQRTHVRRVGESPELRLALGEGSTDGGVEVSDGFRSNTGNAIPITSLATIVTNDLNSDGGVISLRWGGGEINTNFVHEVTYSDRLRQSAGGRVKIEKAILGVVLGPVGKAISITGDADRNRETVVISHRERG